MSSDSGGDLSDTNSALLRAFESSGSTPTPVPHVEQVFDPHQELALLFTWNPLPLHLEASSHNDSLSMHYLPLQKQFYDKHIHAERYLKKVVLHPPLLNNLQRLVDDGLENYQTKGIDLPPVDGEYSAFETFHTRGHGDYVSGLSVADAAGVESKYRQRIIASCSPVASALALDRPFPHWFHLLQWTSTPIGANRLFVTEDLRCKIDGYFLSAAQDPSRSVDPVVACISGTPLERSFVGINAIFSTFLTFQFLPPHPEAERALNGIDDLASLGFFDWNLHQTKGYTASNRVALPKSIDSNNSALLDRSSLPTPTKSSVVGPLNNRRDKVPNATEGCISPPARMGKPPSSQIPTAKQLVQRAWSESVEKDTSLIVFHSGNYERIGVRERSTQTLYLSEVYHIPTCKTHSYAKIHIGLYLAAVMDAISRAERLNLAEERRVDPREKHKRVDTLSARKPRLAKAARPLGRFQRSKRKVVTRRPMMTRDRTHNLLDIGNRNLLLLTLQYDNYHSPAPLSLFRIKRALMNPENADTTVHASRKRQYKPTEYFTLKLGSSIGCGATGVVHLASLVAVLEGKSSFVQPTIVKLAFTSEQQARLRQEYNVYFRLAQAKVEHVLHIWGLFENKSESVTVLVMEHGGVSLRQLKSEDEMPSYAECKPFFDAIDEINKAGVTHGDIRPENLLFDEHGRATIIDYDLAILTPDKSAAPSERDRLEAVLKAYITDPFS